MPLPSHDKSQESFTLCPCLCGCLDPKMAIDIAEVKQRLSDLSSSLSDTTITRKSGGYVICDPPKSTSMLDALLGTEPPPVITVATRSILHFRLQPCSRAFNSWKAHALERRLELEHTQCCIKWLNTRRYFERWRQHTSLCRQLEEQVLAVVRRGHYCACTSPFSHLQWRIHQLSCAWVRWRQSLIVERVSRRAVEQSRQLLLKQVIIE